jgi:hypothetical protein
VISVAHRPSVEEHHTRRWTLALRERGPATLQAA